MQAVMSLYSVGRTTGLSVDSGDGVTYTVPVYEGFAINHAVEKIPLGGRALTNYLQRLLLDNGHNLDSEIVRDIKEKVCYVAQDYEKEVGVGNNEVY